MSEIEKEREEYQKKLRNDEKHELIGSYKMLKQDKLLR